MHRTDNPLARLPLALALIVILLSSLVVRPAFAATQVIAGTAVAGNLRITVQDNGTMNVERFVSGAWQRQIFGNAAKGSNIRINGTQYKIGGASSWGTTGTPVTNVSNTTTGNTITTVWTGGGAQITQRTTYISGNAFYRMQWDIQNTTGAPLPDLRFFHGEDTYLLGGDDAAGFWDAANNTVGARKVVSGVEQRMSLQGSTAPFAYESRQYNLVSGSVNTGALTNVLDTNEGTDNGYALEWRNASLASGATWTIVAFEEFVSGSVGSLIVSAPISTDCTSGTSCNLTYSVSNRNSSAVNATFTLSGNQPTWNPVITSPGASASIPGNGSIPVVVQISVPGATAPGTQGQFTLTANDGTTNSSDIATVTVIAPPDTTPPAPPVITSPSSTSDRTPVFTGTAEAGSTVRLTLTIGGSPVIYQTIATGGNWSIDTGTATPASGSFPPGGLTDNTYPISATARDAANNTSTPATQSLTVDATAPAAPAITSPSITSDRTPVFTGTAEAGSTVRLTLTIGGSPVIYQTIATGGNWSIDTGTATPASGSFPPGGLTDNTYPVGATAADALGNTSTPASQSLVVDATAPASPAITSPSITSDRTPVIAGTAEAGSTVEVSIDLGGSTVAYQVVATGGAWSVDTATASPASGSFPVGGLSDGTYPVSATARDAANNTSSSASQALLVDTTAPAQPTIDSAGTTSDRTPVINGTAEAGSTVEVSIDLGGSTVTYQVVATGGSWSIDTTTATPASGSFPAGGLADGIYPISATATDAANNTSTSASQNLTVDTTAPAAPTISSPAITSDTTPVIAGTAEAGSTVEVSIDLGGSTVTYSVVATGGNWSVDTATASPASGSFPAGGLSDSIYPISATARDALGNTSTSASQALLVDTTAPAQPTIDSADTTSDRTPVINGTAEAGSTVEVSINLGGSTVTYSVVATGGSWSIDTATATPASGSFPAGGLSDGIYPVSATATDAANNTSTPTTQSLEIDATAPTPPAITSPSTTNDSTPVIVGTAEAGSTVELTLDLGGSIVTYSVVAAGGSWSVDTATATPASGSFPAGGLSDSTYPVSATATDALGNTSAAASQALEIDGTTPTAPAITSPSTTNDSTPVIVGTAEAGSTVEVTLDLGGSTVTYQVVATGGNWSVDTATATPASGSFPAGGLTDSTYPISATATDAANNTSTPATQSLEIDATAPTPPAITSPAITSDNTPVIAGTAEAGSTVEVTLDLGGSTVTYQVVATGGSWSVDTATASPASGSFPAGGLSDSTYPVSATATDTFGNTSSSASQALLVDTTAPAQPSIDSAGTTSDRTPVISGTAEAGSAVELTIDLGGSTVTYQVVATGAGSWSVDTGTATPASGSFPAGGLPDSTYPVSATATDAANNTSTPTSQGLVVDATAPAAPAISSPAITSDSTPVIAGTAEAGSTVEVSIDLGGSTVTYSVVATGGAWSVDTATASPTSGSFPAGGLADGTYPVSATATDAFSNTSSSASQALLVDTTAPTQPTIDSAGTTSDRTPVIAGTAEAGSTVELTIDLGGSTVIYQVVATGGSWSVDTATATPANGSFPAGGLADGTYPVSATATDAANNTSTPASQSLEIDATAPTPPAITSPAITSDSTPVIVGTAEAGSTVELTIDLGGSTVTYQVVATGGNWSVDTATATPANGSFPAGGLTDGTYPVSATATDALGNTSAPASQNLTVDASAPVAPTITSPAITSDRTPVISGTAEAGSTVELTIDLGSSTVTYQVVATGGSWSVDTATASPASGSFPAGGLADSTYPISATATDAANNTSSSASQALLVDTTAPAQPTIDSAGTTSDRTPVINGTAEAGSTVELTIDLGSSTVTYQVVATGGSWSVDTATASPASGSFPAGGLADGTYPVSATATDAAGNASTTASQSLEIDATAPVPPTITSPAATSDRTPVIAGTAVSGTTVDITIDLGGSTVTYQVVVTGGSWSVDTATATPASGSFPASGLADGTYPVSVTATDALGNTSAAASQSLVVDATAPAAPAITSSGTASDRTPVISGTAEAGSTVELTIDLGGSTVTYQVVATGGSWSVDTGTATPASGSFPAGGLADSTYPVSATATDAAGNTSPAATQNLTVDVTTPMAPAITSPGGTTDRTPVISGTAEPGSTIEVTIDLGDSSVTYSAVVGQDGSWSIDTGTATPASGSFPASGLTDGPYVISATATDALGNVSPAASASLVVDNTAPKQVPQITSPATTNDRTPVISGIAEPNSVIELTIDLGGTSVVYTVPVDGLGNWSLDTGTAAPASGAFPAGGLPNGDYLLSAQSRDTAGNQGPSVGQELTVLAQALERPLVTSPLQTPDGTPVISGRGEPGTTLTVAIDLDGDGVSDVIYEVGVDAGGFWTLDIGTATPVAGSFPAAGLSLGDEMDVTITAHDLAGNTSPPTEVTIFFRSLTILPIVYKAP